MEFFTLTLHLMSRIRFLLFTFLHKRRELCEEVEEEKKGEAASLYGTLTNSNPVQSAAGGKKTCFVTLCSSIAVDSSF